MCIIHLFVCFNVTVKEVLCYPLIQLRGRVGRADKEAHAYLFYPQKSALSDEALVRFTLELKLVLQKKVHPGT